MLHKAQQRIYNRKQERKHAFDQESKIQEIMIAIKKKKEGVKFLSITVKKKERKHALHQES